jgi:hypothetical protein
MRNIVIYQPLPPLFCQKKRPSPRAWRVRRGKASDPNRKPV